MLRIGRKLLFAAGAALLLCSAQAGATENRGSSGVGGDGFTRWIWYGTDGRVMVEKCNATLAGCTSVTYGPAPTWFPLAYCVTNSNDSYLLWRNTQGLAAIWRLDANMAFVNAALYQGPQVQGWEVYELACDTLPASTSRLWWKNTSGALAAWIINRDLSVGTQQTFTEPFGWYGSPDAGNTATGAASNAKALDKMQQLTQ